MRSIRATERVWDDFGFLADQLRISRADLLEQWVKSSGPPTRAGDGGPDGEATPIQLAIAVEQLTQALTLRANAGGAIKAKIRAALAELVRQ